MDEINTEFLGHACYVSTFCEIQTVVKLKSKISYLQVLQIAYKYYAASKFYTAQTSSGIIQNAIYFSVSR